MVNLQQLLEDSGAVLRGHFKLTSGRHSDIYFEKFRVLEHPPALSALCGQIATHFADSGVDFVVGPTTGGIIIAHETARQMGVNARYVESEDGVKKLRRSATLLEGARVLVVDDVLTTGLSVVETIEVVKSWGAVPVGVGVLIDRASKPLDFGCPHYAAYKVEAETWAEDEIPDWLAKIPITKPGTRKS